MSLFTKEDSIFEKDGKWYWLDQKWEKEYGPYNSKKEASKDMDS